jgi:hypothetical protein
MFPVHAKCVTLDAGWPAERKNAGKKLELGKVYTIRQMMVHQSSTTLEFYEIPGQWNSAFFDAWEFHDDDIEDYGIWMTTTEPRPPLGGNDLETQ